ncbi:ATP-binding cassette transporter snq2, partial [Coemansia sp. BCRC 34490]
MSSSDNSIDIAPVPIEKTTSFGEPLHVSVSRAATRFQSIQRTHGVGEAEEEEEGAEAPPTEFNFQTWLRSRATEGPPFTKRVGLVIKDLDVYGSDVSNKHIASLITPVYKLIKSSIRGFGLLQLLSAAAGSNRRQLLYKITGSVADGEMLLVLGRPGSGCSTLLRVLGNQRKTYTRIDGTVLYGGLTPREVRRHYRGEVAYNQEDDVHFPTLTVRKTLEFAIDCKIPSRQVLQNSGKYKTEFLDMLLDMYGLKACADTIVGNAFLRGVSGGERKRVSIAEQVASGASIDVWDGSTRGLDSSSA